MNLTGKRSFTLPQDVDPDRVEARLQDGILSLRIPKRAETQPKRIQVSNGGAGEERGERAPDEREARKKRASAS